MDGKVSSFPPSWQSQDASLEIWRLRWRACSTNSQTFGS
jgi:hypothetical protein